jgi:formylglycine-generating enzyme required for sulfatase activity
MLVAGFTIVGCVFPPSAPYVCEYEKHAKCETRSLVLASEQVTIPAGYLTFGCDQGDSLCGSSTLAELVWVDAFKIDKFEVTVGDYRQCVCAGACSHASDFGHEFSLVGRCTLCTSGGDSMPVNCVTRDEARSFCEWAGKRLCTEAEWEKAARGGCGPGEPIECCVPGRRFPWGDDLPASDGVDGVDVACDADGPNPVGSSVADVSVYGVHDLAGNVSEHTSRTGDYYTPLTCSVDHSELPALEVEDGFCDLTDGVCVQPSFQGGGGREWTRGLHYSVDCERWATWGVYDTFSLASPVALSEFDGFRCCQ